MVYRGNGVLAIWQDLEPSADRSVHNWYNRQHHPERISIPGFLFVRRYEAISGTPDYFSHYGVEEPAVLATEEYLARVNDPTDWTKREMPNFRNMTRSVCRVEARLGQGEGGCVATWRLAPQAGREDDLRGWLCDEALPAAVKRWGIPQAQFWTADNDTTVIRSNERGLRDEDALADWVVIVQANHADELDALRAEVLPDAALEAHGAAPGTLWASYRLLFSLDREALTTGPAKDGP